jgi:Tfp pilus assembly protein PilW
MKRFFNVRSVTLIELVIGLAIFGIVVLAISQLDLFSNASIIYAQRRIALTNHASLGLEHISRELKQAIGTEDTPAVSNANIIGGGVNYVALRFWVDSNSNYRRDSNDVQRAYRVRLAPGAGRNMLRYCDACTVANNCVTCAGTNEGGGPAGWGILVANDVIHFGQPGAAAGTPPAIVDNYVSVEIRTCSNPASLGTCNTPNNPQVNMEANIRIPSFSTN